MAAIADRYRGTSSFLWRRAFRYSVARNERGQIMDTPVGPREQSESTDSAAQDSYDVIVLGAGPVGQNVAARARAAGLTVAVIERELVGGECSYWGLHSQQVPAASGDRGGGRPPCRRCARSRQQSRFGAGRLRPPRPLRHAVGRHRTSQRNQGDREPN